MSKPLIKILIICFIFQLILLGFVYFWATKTNNPLFNDGECYSSHARIISLVLNGENPGVNFLEENPGFVFGMDEVLSLAKQGRIIQMNSYEVGFITYCYAIVYAIFGYHPFLINIINILMHLLFGVLIYKIGILLFASREAASLSACIALFNPTLLYYSTVKTSESLYMLLAYYSIYAGLKLISKFVLSTAATFTLSLVLLYLVKSHFAILIFASFLLFIVYIIAGKLWRYLKNAKNPRWLRGSILISYLISIGLLLNFFPYMKNIFQIAAVHHLNYVSSGGHTYNLLPSGADFYNYGFYQWLRYFIDAWRHMIFEPLGTPSSLLLLIYYPFKLLFILLCLFGLISFIIRYLQGKKIDLLLMTIFILLGSLIAISGANIGTVLRHRDIITPLVFLYAAMFIIDLQRKLRAGGPNLDQK